MSDTGLTPKAVKEALAALVAADRIAPVRAGRTVTYSTQEGAK